MDENDEKLISEYNLHPSPSTFLNLVDSLRKHKKNELVLEIRMDYISKFSMNEEMWLQWLEDEYKPDGDNALYNQLLQMALNDLPLSVKLRKFKIDHATDKIPAIEEAIDNIGDFDNEIWDEYRKVKPEKADEIFEMQLSRPVPDYDSVLGEYQLQRVMENKPPFEPPKDVQENVERMKIIRSNFKSLSSVIDNVKAFPDKRMFEFGLTYHPYSSQIWVEYLEKFPSPALASRAVRFCPSSGLLWAIYTKITKKVNTSGFLFIENESDAQLLLGQLVSIKPDEAIKIIKDAMKYPIFAEKDSWIWPTYLLEEHMKRCSKPSESSIMERVDLFKAAVERNSQNFGLWDKLISIVTELNDEEKVRNVFREASHKLKVDLPFLIQKWIIFETTIMNPKMDEVIQRINAISEANNENDIQNNEESTNYEKKTIFVANFKDPDEGEAITDQDLCEFFSQIGEVESVRLKKNHGKPSYAFVQFRYEKSAEKAVKILNGAMFKGSKIEVKPHQKQKIYTLYIRFGSNSQPSELIEFLKKNSEVPNFKLRLANESKQNSEPGSKNKMKGWGFIDVFSDEDAMKIMRLSGKLFKTNVLKIEVANKQQKEAFQEKKNRQQIKPIPKQNTSKKDVEIVNQQQNRQGPRLDENDLKNFFGL